MSLNNSFATIVFNTPSKPDEPDLVALVRGHLLDTYNEEAVFTFYDQHPLIFGCKDSNSTVQKTNLSRFWTQQMMGLTDSQSARLHLVPGAEPAIWYKHFVDGVLPYCMRVGAFKKVH